MPSSISSAYPPMAFLLRVYTSEIGDNDSLAIQEGLGDVLHVVHVPHLAVGSQHGDVPRRPVANFPTAVRALEIIPLHGHAVRRTRAEHRLKRGAEHRHATRLRGLGIGVGKNLEERAAYRLRTRDVRGGESLVARGEQSEARRIRCEDQEVARRGLEQRPDIERNTAQGRLLT